MGGSSGGVQAFMLPPTVPPCHTPVCVAHRACESTSPLPGRRLHSAPPAASQWGQPRSSSVLAATGAGGGPVGAGVGPITGGSGGEGGGGSSVRQVLSDTFDALHAKRDAKDQAGVLEVRGVDASVHACAGRRIAQTTHTRKIGRASHLGHGAGVDPEALHHAHLRFGRRGAVAGDGAGAARDEKPGVGGEQGTVLCDLCVARPWEASVGCGVCVCVSRHATRPLFISSPPMAGDVRRRCLGLRLRAGHDGGAARDGRDARGGRHAGRGGVQQHGVWRVSVYKSMWVWGRLAVVSPYVPLSLSLPLNSCTATSG